LAFATFLVCRLRTGACGVGACGFGAIECPPKAKTALEILYCLEVNLISWFERKQAYIIQLPFDLKKKRGLSSLMCSDSPHFVNLYQLKLQTNLYLSASNVFMTC